MTGAKEDDRAPTRAVPAQHGILPMRFAALAAGLFAGMHLARIALSSALPLPGLVAAGAFLLVFGALGFDHALSKRVAPRSRRLPLAMRFGFLASLGIVGFITTERLGMMAFAGASLAVLLALAQREARVPSKIQLVPPAFVGAAIAFALHATLSTQRAWVAVAWVVAMASFSCLAAVLRGGPGRAPARPLDALWLFGLGGAFALSLALVR